MKIASLRLSILSVNVMCLIVAGDVGANRWVIRQVLAMDCWQSIYNVIHCSYIVAIFWVLIRTKVWCVVIHCCNDPKNRRQCIVGRPCFQPKWFPHSNFTTPKCWILLPWEGGGDEGGGRWWNPSISRNNSTTMQSFIDFINVCSWMTSCVSQLLQELRSR